MKKSRSGFTLVEILIVVVILGILAAIVIPQFSDASTEARQSSLESTVQAIQSQIELYRIKDSGGDWPAGTAAEMLATLVTDGYLRKVPVEPFGGNWTYDSTDGDFGSDSDPNL